jgi:hypothetical protein
MANYTLDQRCWPSGSLRVAELAALLSLISRVCGSIKLRGCGRGSDSHQPGALKQC